MHSHLQQTKWPLPEKTLREAKALGFSDQAIEELLEVPTGTVREARKRHAIQPHLAQIDTLASRPDRYVGG
jgi:hypothetical protein